MTVVRIPGCYTYPWLLYTSLVVIRIPGCCTHPWLLYASLVVIRNPDRDKPP